MYFIYQLPPPISLILIISFISTSVYINLRLTRFVLKTYAGLLQRRNLKNRAKLLSLIGIKDEGTATKKVIIGFLHPYCNAGGGGERVLWTAVALHQRTEPDTICAIYTGDLEVSKQEIIHKVKSRFGIILDPSSLLLVPLKTRYLVEASTWPRCTLLGQSLGSLVLGYEALSALIPDIYIDTMGYAFTFPVFRLLTDVPIGAYVHYPTISNDMLQRVSRRNSAHNNSSTISNSVVLSYAKLIYYIIFAELYSFCLRQAHHLMVNSSWTKNHIDRLLQPWLYRDEVESEETPQDWTTSSDPSQSKSLKPGGLRLRIPSTKDERNDTTNIPKRKSRKFVRSTVVYPPCDVESFLDFPISPRKLTILSISQFRPEKDQGTQIKAFARFLSTLESDDPRRTEIKLVLAGSCRDHADHERVAQLKELAHQLGVSQTVLFLVNVSWDQLKNLLKESLVGISTMIDEHFGISIVEFMASGMIPLVHRSAGPLLDIVVPLGHHHQGSEERRTGFHADGEAEYAAHLAHIFCSLSPDERIQIQSDARLLARTKFGVGQFERLWINSFRQIVAKNQPD
ncbi:asparagine-linked glycosylation protein [Puccinia graminis f. sp. tritici]|uniref:GDP-Man:Man(3)GlcNAc(2)-PP-Dol alpha-1,2-mannosyltransferase n=2 Tax=Puccinia graminis f. sp. tritici TaxID=56615 RepID=E3JYG1_PUCGT|nr:uncharacterized protein PGTG_03042 [Puccinia graminis f. sp. tritici CRL 75-36-700-3]EFP77086.1 hypothetical protein PGTG_03042 [Puccinia graminis f. sp. tritici CRL 75-36-700-3]KAA1114561.1 asparagine-linked glycosylation protein [Puccinia graminis f. sp. tritici]